MEIGLLILLLLIFILPLTLRKVEDNLEIFLFVVGVIAIIISNSLSLNFIIEIFENKFLYMITGAVLIGGFLFKALNKHIQKATELILTHIPLKLFVFIMIVFVGMISSIITAIIAALLLVEIIETLPIKRQNKVKIDIIACFSIGMGAILTPIGEPLSTIVFTKLNLDFWYMLLNLGIYVIPAIIILGIIGTYFAVYDNTPIETDKLEFEKQPTSEIILRSAKIFLFIIALELLGKGFTPLVETYLLQLDSNILYWLNMSSAVLDNATLAAAEISIKMSTSQINAILIGLLVSGGMMIPGNIPNIITSSKLQIKSSEWMKFGIPLGLIIMIIYYFIFFII